MSKNNDIKNDIEDEKTEENESIVDITEKQLQKIKELESQFGDRYIPTDDATKIINVEEVEEKLVKEETDIFKSDTNELNFEIGKPKEEVKIRDPYKDDEDEDNIIEEVDDMPRRSKKRKSASSKNKKTKGKANTKKGKNKKKTTKGKLIFRWIIAIVLLLILIVIGLGFGYIFGVFGNDNPLTKEDLLIANENSTVYDRDGKLVATLAEDEKREIVKLSDMPDYIPKMYLAIEDERFYKHHGVDFQRTTTATLSYILKGGKSDYGASTITQQLIKNVTEDDERSWERKLREITRALQVEREITKEQVLELYLNVIFVGGDNIHGVALGADYYFNKSQKELTMAEAAFMAGINHMPNAYNPFLLSASDLSEEEAKAIDDDKKIAKKDKEKAKLAKVKEENREMIKDRTMVVLNKIYKDLKWISEEDYNKAVEEVEKGFKFKIGQKAKSTLKYSYITDAAIDEVIEMIMKEKDISRELAEMRLYNGGYKIYTTQNSGMQKIAEEDMKDDYYMLTSNITKDSKGEYVHSQASMTIIDHKTGQVVVAVGGLGDDVQMTKGDWNRTTRTLRQLGSSMKPIGVAAPGLESGTLTAATVYDDTPFGGYNNFGFGYRGYTNIRKGIEVSNNIIFLKAVSEMGEETSAKFLESVGFRITDDDKNIASLALGGLTYGVSTTQVAGAYAAIANGGEFIEPTFVLKVEDSSGKEVMKPQQRKERVLSEQNAYILQQMMTSTVEGAEGTGSYAKVSGFDTGVKTGTTNDDKDRWLCGFTPKLTAAVWYGFDVAEEIFWNDINPAGLIWRNNMRAIHDKYYETGEEFSRPDGIVEVAVCRDSGMLPSKNCKNEPRGSRVYTEYFVEGTEPTEVCNHHEEVEVCKISGLLPTAECKDKVKKSFLKKDNRLSAADLGYTAPTTKCDVCAKVESENKNKAKEISSIIEGLPSDGSLTLSDESSVNSANAKYNQLSAAVKQLISEANKNKLSSAVKKIKELKEEAAKPVTPPKPPVEEPEPGDGDDDGEDENGGEPEPTTPPTTP